MLRRTSGFMLWVLLAVAVAVAPLACGSSSSTGDGAIDTTNVTTPDAMTQS